MIRHLILIGAYGVTASAVVAASPIMSSPRHLLAHQQHGWMSPDANIRHIWMYVVGVQTNAVSIYDLQKAERQR